MMAMDDKRWRESTTKDDHEADDEVGQSVMTNQGDEGRDPSMRRMEAE